MNEGAVMDLPVPQAFTVKKQRQANLMHILNRNHRSQAMRFIEQFPDLVDQPNMNGTTPLISACKKRLNGVALAILSTNNANPWHSDKFGETALFWAIVNNMTDVLAVLNSIALNRSGLI